MDKVLKNKKINHIILFLYLTFVFFTQIFIRVDNPIFIILLTVIFALLSYFLSKVVIYLLNIYRFKFEKLKTTKTSDFFIRFIFFLIIFIIGMFLLQLQWHIFTRELSITDTAYDLQDCIKGCETNIYNNWHPFLYNMIFVKFPLFLSHGNINFIYIFSLIIRSLIVSYITSDIYIKYNNKIFAILLLIFYTLTPLSIYATYCGLKDTPYGFMVLLFIYLIFKIRYEKIDDNIIYFIAGIALALATIFRHNSWFFTIPSIIVLYIIFKKEIKNFFKIFITFLLLIIIVNGPIISIFNVAPGDPTRSTVEEAMGMPLSVLSYIARVKPDALNDKEYQLMDKLSSHDFTIYQKYDERQGYDSIKPNEPVASRRVAVINEMDLNYIDFLSMFFDLMIREPRFTFKQIFNLTCGVYALRYRPSTEGDPTSIIAKAYWLAGSLEIPISLFIIISTILAFNNVSSFKNYQVLLVIPILIYTFGTMCLLSANGIHRYFISTQMVMPIYYLFNSKLNER